MYPCIIILHAVSTSKTVHLNQGFLMADTKTWIDVADTAVKIGLGALLGGAFAVWVAFLNNKSQASKVYLERKRCIIESVVGEVDLFHGAAAFYWANLSNAVFKRDSNNRLSHAETEELKKLEQQLFEGFKSLGGCSSKLLLIGEGEAETKLRGMRNAIDDFFRVANIENKKCTTAALDGHKKTIQEKREELYLALSKSFARSV